MQAFINLCKPESWCLGPSPVAGLAHPGSRDPDRRRMAGCPCSVISGQTLGWPSPWGLLTCVFGAEWWVSFLGFFVPGLATCWSFFPWMPHLPSRFWISAYVSTACPLLLPAWDGIKLPLPSPEWQLQPQLEPTAPSGASCRASAAHNRHK